MRLRPSSIARGGNRGILQWGSTCGEGLRAITLDGMAIRLDRIGRLQGERSSGSAMRTRVWLFNTVDAEIPNMPLNARLKWDESA